MFNSITKLPDNAVVFDTETTGFDPLTGDRIVEIGAVKMRGGLPTKEKFHLYVNPGRNVPQEAFDVHGLSGEFLSAYPAFEDTVDQFIDFIEDLPLIAHNSKFDAKFINFELEQANRKTIEDSRFFDSLAVARRIYPGQNGNLDALCKRHKISLANRGNHGALIDSELLAEVIVEMGGGRQTTMFDAVQTKSVPREQRQSATPSVDTFVKRATDEETEKHKALVAKLGENAIWNQVQV